MFIENDRRLDIVRNVDDDNLSKLINSIYYYV